MTEVNETTPRRRGRPRKDAEDNPEPQVASDFKDLKIQALQEELEAMRAENEYRMAIFEKLAAKLGLDDLPKPPNEDTLVIDSVESEPMPQTSSRPQPGSLLGQSGDRNVGWIPWRKEDLDPQAYMEFVPAPIPSLVFPMTDEEGRQKIRLDVNDLVCWLTVGVPNRVNRFFYNAYMDAYNTWRELENFKRKGPSVAPWGNLGPNGQPSWYFEPMALSFGMDDDGHALTPFRGSNPLRAFQQHVADSEAI